MKTYRVTITEKLEITVEIEASSRSEAERLVEKGWINGEYILDVDNFNGVEFTTNQPQRDRGTER
jgi:hypothetical protein